MNGSGMKVGQLKDFLKASYEDKPPHKIGAFMIDNKLSNDYGKVYFSISQKKVVIVFRGTKGVLDWGNNISFLMNSNSYKFTNRFKIAKKMYDEAHKKYKGYKFELTGHSQGGIPTNLLLNENEDIDGIALNPAYKLGFIKNNEYIVKSNLDPVSVLHKPKELINKVLNPNWNKNHIINIPSNNYNLLEQHKVDVLNNLDQNKFIGSKGGSLYNKNIGQFPFD
jgi:hypothetical protein